MRETPQRGVFIDLTEAPSVWRSVGSKSKELLQSSPSSCVLHLERAFDSSGYPAYFFEIDGNENLSDPQHIAGPDDNFIGDLIGMEFPNKW